MKDREILEFRIDAFTPDNLPMARLAEYLAQLAALYGSREAVHFQKVGKGSAVLSSWVERTESGPVITRIQRAPTSDAPEDAKRAYQRIDEMLRENNAVADIKRKDAGKILSFPGRKLPEIKPIIVSEYGEIDGVVVRVGGTGNTIPVHLQPATDEAPYPCHVLERAMARELAALLYGDPIRARGKGEWQRSADGKWKLISMAIDGWERLDTTPLNEVFDQLRAVPGNGWKKIVDPTREVRRIRDGE